jgi:hypothetical protein
VSHMPKFGDASKSPAGDTASRNCGICDTAKSLNQIYSSHLSVL